MDISVVVPIYNEEGNIPVLYERLKKVLTEMDVGSHELIFVNDGSSDRSFSLLKELSDKDTALKYIDLSRNFGHQVALTAGLDKAGGDAVVIIDADLQDPPELIPALYQKHLEGYEVVYAQRRSRKGEGVIKRFTASLFYRVLSKVTSIDIPLDTGDFRLIDKKVVKVLRQMPEQEKFLRGQISWIGYRQTCVTYDRDERHAGKTGYSYKKVIRLALDGITSFSNFPLRFASIMGFIVSCIAFAGILYALYGYFLMQRVVPGWTSLMLSILFLGGIQLVVIGIIGEYIGRMSNNVRKRPLYVVKESNME